MSTIRKMTTGTYRPTESFKSIPEHIAVMFEDNQILVALVGASDDDPDNLAETKEIAELFASAPAMLARLSALEAAGEGLIRRMQEEFHHFSDEDKSALAAWREARGETK